MRLSDDRLERLIAGSGLAACMAKELRVLRKLRDIVAKREAIKSGQFAAWLLEYEALWEPELAPTPSRRAQQAAEGSGSDHSDSLSVFHAGVEIGRAERDAWEAARAVVDPGSIEDSRWDSYAAWLKARQEAEA